MTVVETLKWLAHIAPDVCHNDDDEAYTLGEYTFWLDDDGIFTSEHADHLNCFVKGRPALAWLADALMAECEKRRWSYSMKKYAFATYIAKINGIDSPGIKSSIIESLLSAFLAAMEGER